MEPALCEIVLSCIHARLGCMMVGCSVPMLIPIDCYLDMDGIRMDGHAHCDEASDERAGILGYK